MKRFPKENITELRLKRGFTGNKQRFLLQKDSFNNNFYLPTPVEYEDIDTAFVEFIDKEIEIEANGQKVPTYTLFSNHRFTEFSQTYEHTDEDGNLLMDFKTVGRENNPKFGSGQDGLYNIPGHRRYTTGIRNVLDKNGTEHYEISSMEQPVSVDFVYTVSYVTADFSKLNDFNMKLIFLFKSAQHYIKPNGYEMPLYLDEISDESEYSIDNRKIFIQSASIILKGYVIPKETLRIEKYPKRMNIGVVSDFNSPKPLVEVESENDKDIIVINFPKKSNSVTFTFDEELYISSFESENIRSFKLKVNDVEIPEKKEGTLLLDCDEIKIEIIPIDFSFPSVLKIIGKSQPSS